MGGAEFGCKVCGDRLNGRNAEVCAKATCRATARPGKHYSNVELANHASHALQKGKVQRMPCLEGPG